MEAEEDGKDDIFVHPDDPVPWFAEQIDEEATQTERPLRLKRRKRCGQCGPCQVKTNCGECPYCIRRSVLKQSCIYRKCIYLRKPVSGTSRTPPKSRAHKIQETEASEVSVTFPPEFLSSEGELDSSYELMSPPSMEITGYSLKSMPSDDQDQEIQEHQQSQSIIIQPVGEEDSYVVEEVITPPSSPRQNMSTISSHLTCGQDPDSNTSNDSNAQPRLVRTPPHPMDYIEENEDFVNPQTFNTLKSGNGNPPIASHNSSIHLDMELADSQSAQELQSDKISSENVTSVSVSVSKSLSETEASSRSCTISGLESDLSVMQNYAECSTSEPIVSSQTPLNQIDNEKRQTPIVPLPAYSPPHKNDLHPSDLSQLHSEILSHPIQSINATYPSKERQFFSPPNVTVGRYGGFTSPKLKPNMPGDGHTHPLNLTGNFYKPDISVGQDNQRPRMASMPSYPPWLPDGACYPNHAFNSGIYPPTSQMLNYEFMPRFSPYMPPRHPYFPTRPEMIAQYQPNSLFPPEKYPVHPALFSHGYYPLPYRHPNEHFIYRPPMSSVPEMFSRHPDFRKRTVFSPGPSTSYNESIDLTTERYEMEEYKKHSVFRLQQKSPFETKNVLEKNSEHIDPTDKNHITNHESSIASGQTENHLTVETTDSNNANTEHIIKEVLLSEENSSEPKSKLCMLPIVGNQTLRQLLNHTNITSQSSQNETVRTDIDEDLRNEINKVSNHFSCNVITIDDLRMQAMIRSDGVNNLEIEISSPNSEVTSVSPIIAEDPSKNAGSLDTLSKQIPKPVAIKGNVCIKQDLGDEGLIMMEFPKERVTLVQCVLDEALLEQSNNPKELKDFIVSSQQSKHLDNEAVLQIDKPSGTNVTDRLSEIGASTAKAMSIQPRNVAEKAYRSPDLSKSQEDSNNLSTDWKQMCVNLFNKTNQQKYRASDKDNAVKQTNYIQSNNEVCNSKVTAKINDSVIKSSQVLLTQELHSSRPQDIQSLEGHPQIPFSHELRTNYSTSNAAVSLCHLASNVEFQQNVGHHQTMPPTITRTSSGDPSLSVSTVLNRLSSLGNKASISQDYTQLNIPQISNRNHQTILPDDENHSAIHPLNISTVVNRLSSLSSDALLSYSIHKDRTLESSKRPASEVDQSVKRHCFDAMHRKSSKTSSLDRVYDPSNRPSHLVNNKPSHRNKVRPEETIRIENPFLDKPTNLSKRPYPDHHHPGPKQRHKKSRFEKKLYNSSSNSALIVNKLSNFVDNTIKVYGSENKPVASSEPTSDSMVMSLDYTADSPSVSENTLEELHKKYFNNSDSFKFTSKTDSYFSESESQNKSRTSPMSLLEKSPASKSDKFEVYSKTTSLDCEEEQMSGDRPPTAEINETEMVIRKDDVGVDREMEKQQLQMSIPQNSEDSSISLNHKPLELATKDKHDTITISMDNPYISFNNNPPTLSSAQNNDSLNSDSQISSEIANFSNCDKTKEPKDCEHVDGIKHISNNVTNFDKQLSDEQTINISNLNIECVHSEVSDHSLVNLSSTCPVDVCTSINSNSESVLNEGNFSVRSLDKPNNVNLSCETSEFISEPKKDLSNYSKCNPNKTSDSENCEIGSCPNTNKTSNNNCPQNKNTSHTETLVNSTVISNQTRVITSYSSESGDRANSESAFSNNSTSVLPELKVDQSVNDCGVSKSAIDRFKSLGSDNKLNPKLCNKTDSYIYGMQLQSKESADFSKCPTLAEIIQPSSHRLMSDEPVG